MATALNTTFCEVTGTPVSRAFSRLLNRLAALIDIEHDFPRAHSQADHDRHCNAVEAAHSALMEAASDVLSEAVERDLDGPLRRLALIAELQMSIECPHERQHLFETIQNNRDVFDIGGCSRAAQDVRQLQTAFFTLYAALVEGPEFAPTGAEQTERDSFVPVLA